MYIPDFPSGVRYSGTQSFMATTSRVEILGRGSRKWLEITVPQGSAGGRVERGE